MNTMKRFVMFATNTNENGLAERFIKPIGFKKVQGAYKGQLEDSYLVLANEDTYLNTVRKLAKLYNQESILIVNEDRKAYLEYIGTGKQVYIGQWTSIDSLTAQSLDNWTLDGVNYYACL